MRYEKEWFLSSEFSCWRAVLYNDTSQLLSSLALQPQGLNHEILPIPASGLSRNRAWVTPCLHGRPRLGIYKHCRSPLCTSIPHSTRLGPALPERKQLWSPRAPAPIPL